MTTLLRRQRLQVDWFLIGLTVLLCAVGLVTLYSAAGSPLDVAAPRAFRMQAGFVAAGLAGMALAGLVPPRSWAQLAYPAYIGVVVLLALVLLFGPVRGGSQRWLPVGPVNLQPSELAKVAIVLAGARWFSTRHQDDGWGLRGLVMPALLFLAPVAALTFVEPDLGTTLFLGFVFAGVAFAVGLRWKVLAAVALLGAGTAPLAYRFILDDYQRDRVDVLFAPEADPKGKGYQAIQGRYAIGSGRLTGKGWRQSTQGRLAFLPEQHTDFIFSVWAEERGFVGSVLLLALYGALLLRGLWIAWNARDRFGSILAAGLVAVLFSHICINLGGVLGLLPITGVTLPLVSYGGSSVLTMLGALGLLLSVSMRRRP